MANAQKLGLSQGLQQRLSPQQIQLVKLFQIPTSELETRIEQELEENPALEEGPDEYTEENQLSDPETSNSDELSDSESIAESDKINIDDYIRDSDNAGYKLQGDGPDPNEEERESPLASASSLLDSLISQLGFLKLSKKEELIGLQLIGSIDSDGYIRRDLDSILNDLAFSQNLIVSRNEIEKVLNYIQLFEPAGIAAQNLQECLILQLDRKTDNYEIAYLAIRIVEDCFEEFKKKHYEKIQKKLEIEDYEQLKAAISMISKLNPKPGEQNSNEGKAEYIIPDFIVHQSNGKLEVMLNDGNSPELRVSKTYNKLLIDLDAQKNKTKQVKETIGFIKSKIDSAKWFIDAIQQRHQTLLKTMRTIVEIQKDFFLSGDESKLKPMILKDVASIISMDVSTVSRVTSSKYVQTEYGTFHLKYFFSEGITSDSGEDVSSREIKAILKNLIDTEDKSKPLADDKLEILLSKSGYQIARRTVAKYREQLDIPVARLRKSI